MDITKLTAKELNTILRLLNEKEALLSKIASIDKQLSAFQSTGAPIKSKALKTAKASRKTSSPKSTSGSKAPSDSTEKKKSAKKKPLPLKKLIVDLLQNAGHEGLHVKDIAKKLNLPNNNIFSWFYTTGKKFNNIKRIAEGRFAWHHDVSTPSTVEPPANPAPEPVVESTEQNQPL